MVSRCFLGWCAISVALSWQTPSAGAVQETLSGTEAIAVHTADVDGLQLQYLSAGHGPAILLLHGYAETSRMWRPLIPRLAADFTVIAPDPPGIGAPHHPPEGLDITHDAARAQALGKTLGLNNAAGAGPHNGLT